MLNETQKNQLRNLPAVNKLLQDKALQNLIDHTSYQWVSQETGRYIENLREHILNNKIGRPLSYEEIVQGLIAFLEQEQKPHLKRVINATGIVLHTNLGRAKLSIEAYQAMEQAAIHYSNLEYNLKCGKRGSRYDHVETLLCCLTGAEAAMVVNNNAAAVFLVLREIARGKEVVVSRGQLVEIGGSFRVSEIMAESGAHLVEVGTTNKTHLYDYESHLTDNTAMIMKVHTSNFKTIGFTEEVPLEELVELAHWKEIPVYEDLGSGVLYDLKKHGIGEEPTVQEVVEKGCDIVTFSGDKLLGGPQAGIIVGKKRWIDRLKRNQLTRALRVDKFSFAALEATLRLYLMPEKVTSRIPTLEMILTPIEALHQKAGTLHLRLKAALKDMADVTLDEGKSEVGGGSLPGVQLPTWIVTVKPHEHSTVSLETALRNTDPPLVGRVNQGRVCLDVRTIDTSEFDDCVRSFVQAFKHLDQSS